MLEIEPVITTPPSTGGGGWPSGEPDSSDRRKSPARFSASAAPQATNPQEAALRRPSRPRLASAAPLRANAASWRRTNRESRSSRLISFRAGCSGRREATRQERQSRSTEPAELPDSTAVAGAHYQLGGGVRCRPRISAVARLEHPAVTVLAPGAPRRRLAAQQWRFGQRRASARESPDETTRHGGSECGMVTSSAWACRAGTGDGINRTGA